MHQRTDEPSDGWTNGQTEKLSHLPSNHLNDHPFFGTPSRLVIPSGHCWIEGDNHSDSVDSNDFGPLPLGLVRSKALAVVWPKERWRWLNHQLDPDEYGGRVTWFEEARGVE